MTFFTLLLVFDRYLSCCFRPGCLGDVLLDGRLGDHARAVLSRCEMYEVVSVAARKQRAVVETIQAQQVHFGQFVSPESPSYRHFVQKVDVGASMAGGNAGLEREEKEEHHSCAL